MNFHFEYITQTVSTYFLDRPLTINPNAGSLLIQGKTQNSDIPTIDGIYTLSEYVDFFSSLQNVYNLSLTIFLSLEGSAVMIYTGIVPVTIFLDKKLQYTFFYHNRDSVFFSGTQQPKCFDIDIYDEYDVMSNITYYLDSVHGSLSIGPYTGATQIKGAISEPHLDFAYDYYFDVNYKRGTDKIVLVDYAVCKDQTYTTNLKFSVYFVFSGDFKCDSQSLDTKPCQLVTACNENNKENCTKYFDMYRIRCQNELSSDFCYNFVQNFYSVEGPQSQMDNLIAQYCSNKNASQIFSKNQQNQSQQNQRDFMLCGCHMSDTFYKNFHRSVKQYTEDKGYEINEYLFGQKEICLFPPCTLASGSFPAQGIGKCDNDVCFNIISYENDGTVKDGENITIIQNPDCFVKQNGVKAKAFLGFQTRQGLMLSDVFLLIIIVIITVVFVCILRFYRRGSNKGFRIFK
jgi:hypothetical protein